MCPGRSWVQFKFKYEGYWYYWEDNMMAYFNDITGKQFNKPPIGATWDETCFCPEWPIEDEEDDEYYD